MTDTPPPATAPPIPPSGDTPDVLEIRPHKLKLQDQEWLEEFTGLGPGEVQAALKEGRAKAVIGIAALALRRERPDLSIEDALADVRGRDRNEFEFIAADPQQTRD